MQGTIEDNGGRYHMQLPNTPEGASEIKFRDPNGVVFDIVTTQYAEKAWEAKTDTGLRLVDVQDGLAEKFRSMRSLAKRSISDTTPRVQSHN